MTALAVGLLAAAYGGLLTAAVLTAPRWLLGCAVVVAAVEAGVAWRGPFVGWMLGRVGLGGPARGLVRGLAAVVFVVQVGLADSWLLLTGAGVLAFAALSLGGAGLAEVLRRMRRMPMVSRGLDLAPVRIPAALPAPLAMRADSTLPLADVGLLAGLALAAPAGRSAFAIGGAISGLVLLTVAVGVLAWSVLAMRRLPAVRLTAAIRRALADVAPRTALYFGGGPDQLYQLEMWLATFERLEVPTVVILRDRAALRQLGPTRLPVLCVEPERELHGLELNTVRVVFYVAHAASNVHMLRRRTMRHVFIGHGDSDKAVSSNPFTKAYDEQWVAGPAALERFRAAQVDVDERRVVQIGRPQLDPMRAQRPSSPGFIITVLYAPTWEGHADEPHQTSLATFGVDLVRWLLAESDVRILYRPHPLVGVRDAGVRAADREIVRLLGAASMPAPPVDVADEAARARDDLAVAAISSEAATMSRTERLAALEVWSRKQLDPGEDDQRHLVVPGPQFSLFTCFEAADALLSDVSSVVSDYVVTGKPYGVTNPGALDHQVFCDQYPSARGGYVVAPDGTGLAAMLSAARGDGDPALSERVALQEWLVGPGSPPALRRMRAQVARLVRDLPDQDTSGSGQLDPGADTAALSGNHPPPVSIPGVDAPSRKV